jgi:hypothetical protein
MYCQRVAVYLINGPRKPSNVGMSVGGTISRFLHAYFIAILQSSDVCCSTKSKLTSPMLQLFLVGGDREVGDLTRNVTGLNCVCGRGRSGIHWRRFDRFRFGDVDFGR